MSDTVRGLAWGLLGVAAFSLTLPATRVAVAALDVGFVVVGRCLGAALLAGAVLWATRQPWPAKRDLWPLVGVALGLVVGFPLFTTYAMQTVPSFHGAIVIGLLPLATAIVGAIFGGERPSLAFWATGVAGSAVIVAFVLHDTAFEPGVGDLALVGSVISAGFGYAIGGLLARRMAAWQVICWALVLSLPALVPAGLWTLRWPETAVPASSWLGFGYVTVVSQLVGFFAWYRGLALGGIARVGQLQLLQVFMTLAASAVLLGEQVGPHAIAYAAAVVALVALGARLRIGTKRPT